MIFTYIRTSVWRKNKITMEMQQNAIQARLDELDLPHPESDHVFEDRGISGDKFKERPGLQALLKQLQEPAAAHSTLFVYRLNRLSRDTSIMVSILGILDKNDIKLVSVMEPLPENGSKALRKMFIYIHSTAGQFERDMLIENVHAVLAHKRQAGKPLSAKVPFGYCYTRDRLEPIASELAVVRLIYDLYLTESLGYKKIAKHLTAKGHLFHDRHFAARDVHDILSNETYCGILKGGTVGGAYKGNHQTVITGAEFKAVQRIRAQKQVKKISTRTNWLRRKIICPVCGRHLTPRSVSRENYVFAYYYCAKPKCKEKMLNADTMEQQVKKAVLQFIIKNPVLDQTLAEVHHLQKSKQQEVKLSEKQVKRAKEKLFLQFESGQITATTFTQTLSQLAETVQAPPNADQAAITKTYLANLVAQRSHIKAKKLPEAFYFNLVDRVDLNTHYEIEAIYLKSLDMNILKQEEIIL